MPDSHDRTEKSDDANAQERARKAFERGVAEIRTPEQASHALDSLEKIAGNLREEDVARPLEHERLLISVGADHAAMAIRQKCVEEERIFLLEREREAHREAERASRLREEFLAVLSHELRTTLNSVLG